MKKIFPTLFPKQINNIYKGHKVALAVFYIITAVTLARSLVHIFAPDGGAQSIATFPLDTFTENGANAVILMFGLWGLSQLIIGLIYVAVAIRYRALVPAVYLLFIIEYAGRTAISYAKPVILEGQAPGGVMNIPAVVVGIILLVLALIPPKGNKSNTSNL